jgi:putative heme transporter
MIVADLERTTMTTIAPPATPRPRRLPDRIAPVGQNQRHLTRRLLLLATALFLAAEVFLQRGWLTSAVDAVASSSWRWLVAAAAAAVASMWCFGAVRQRTLLAAGVEVPVRRAVSMSYAAGAIHSTLPGGGVFSTAYAFRQVRRWGASAAVATWCMAITGLLAAATLALVGLGGLLLGAGLAVPAIRLVVEIAIMIVLFGVIVHLTRRPEQLLPVAEAGLRAMNRLRRRPATAGSERLRTLVADLRTIQPSGRQWAGALGLSLANWLFDIGCLAACCAALGVHVSLSALLLTYTAGMAAASVSPLPAGLGIVEGALILGLTTAGAAAPAALAAVLVYRLLSTGGIVLVGWSILGLRRRDRRSEVGPLHPADVSHSVRGGISAC